jgi:hypothetical protein
MASSLLKRGFTAAYRTGISNDLVVSASMGWTAKKPTSHLEHLQLIKGMHI